MEMRIMIVMFLCFGLMISSCNTNNQQDCQKNKQSSYQVGDLPDMVVIVEAVDSDTLSIREYYPDTMIVTEFTSRDSVGKYFYYQGVSYMSKERLNDAISSYKFSVFYGYLVATSYSAIGNCYYQMNQNDSALLYLNKALEVDPNEGAAKLIKNWIEKGR